MPTCLEHLLMTETYKTLAMHSPKKPVIAAETQASEVLARAMKEWERRPGERQGFSDGPGDCMAFKYLRDVSRLYHCYFVLLSCYLVWVLMKSCTLLLFGTVASLCYT